MPASPSSSPTPASSPDAPGPGAPPTAHHLADLIHTALAGVADQPHLVGVTFEPDGDVSLAFWQVPATLADPVAPLVGYRAPTSWHAVALTCSARRHDLATPGAPSRAVTTTVVRTRDGGSASVLSGPDVPWERIDHPPVGPAADVLARVLGCPTPPAEHGSGILVDLTWLERIAASRPGRSSRHLDWAHLADRHPLRRTGATPSPLDLRERTDLEATANTWAHLRSRSRDVALPAANHGPPGGQILRADQWFDDGAMCRWSMRQSLPVPILLEAALSPLAEDVARQVFEALAEATRATALPAP